MKKIKGLSLAMFVASLCFLGVSLKATTPQKNNLQIEKSTENWSQVKNQHGIEAYFKVNHDGNQPLLMVKFKNKSTNVETISWTISKVEISSQTSLISNNEQESGELNLAKNQEIEQNTNVVFSGNLADYSININLK